MPIYEYQCEGCEHEFESMQRMSEPPLTQCPSCGKDRLKKKISAVAFRLKGGGWYETDFKSGDKKNVASSSDSGGESTSSSASNKSEKSDSKSSSSDSASSTSGSSTKSSSDAGEKSAKRSGRQERIAQKRAEERNQIEGQQRQILQDLTRETISPTHSLAERSGRPLNCDRLPPRATFP